ncbi:ribonuclease HI [Neorickettsia sennetsu]|uniref:Ribonuclease H n=1 Tax=Ehrlichia sennetsu (strain ATCC VR-367 / Miyayama) TaxID=222891 RepID=RNH_EHRS3|nr:ribonuclease HI [Neorickettsia sennetsu]Q2GDA1.1 RecName: Full=Ribonuclease H; Short=RNase H [Neorickettsia sennetsu str. Miyayama]ABD45876.1 ribonuclease HI [Neorickettsia sennetsu str. Miyayama]
MEEYVIYTDGACLGNPGPGGWAAVIIQRGTNEKIISGREADSTNNKMELLAVIKALESFEQKGKRVTVYTDSTYVYKGITAWIESWMKNKWRNSSGGAVKNKEMWVRLHGIAAAHTVRWLWVKAHNGDHYNEIVDRVARKEAASFTNCEPE